MSRDRRTEDAARSAASDMIEIASAPNGIALISESPRRATAAPSREYPDMPQIAARPTGRSIGWMAFCLES
jgi:hypothetical protein